MIKSTCFMVVLLAIFTITGCGISEEVGYERIIPADKQEAALSWIQDVVDAAYKEGHNGGELEDPEKVVAEASKTAVEIYGELTVGLNIYVTDVMAAKRFIAFVPYEECSGAQKIKINDFLQRRRHKQY